MASKNFPTQSFANNSAPADSGHANSILSEMDHIGAEKIKFIFVVNPQSDQRKPMCQKRFYLAGFGVSAWFFSRQHFVDNAFICLCRCPSCTLYALCVRVVGSESIEHAGHWYTAAIFNNAMNRNIKVIAKQEKWPPRECLESQTHHKH